MRVVNDRRVKPRAALRGDAVVYSARDQIRCHCLDVSAGGMALLGPRPARIRERVIVQAQFGSMPLQGEAIVVRGRRTAHGHLWGLRFLRLDDQMRANLERYVQQTLAHAARVRQAQLFAARAWGRSTPADVPPPTHAPPMEPTVSAAPVAAPVAVPASPRPPVVATPTVQSPQRAAVPAAAQPPASYQADVHASAFATLPGGVQTPGYASLQEAELAERQAQLSSPSADAAVFDPQIQDGDGMFDHDGVYEPSSAVGDEEGSAGGDDEDDLSSMDRTRAQGPGTRSDLQRSDSRRSEPVRGPGLGPVSPPSFDEDAPTHQVARPPAAPSFDEWEQGAALPSSSSEEPQLDAVEDTEIERGEGSFAWFEPNLYEDSGAALPFPGDDEPPKTKAASSAGRNRAPMLLDGEEGVPDMDAPVFGDIVEATERPASSSRYPGASSPADLSRHTERIDETDVRRGFDPEQYTPVGTLPPVQVTEPTPVGSLQARTRPRAQRSALISALDETGPVSVGSSNHSTDGLDDDAGTDPHYAVLPEYDYPDPDLPRHDDDFGSDPSPAQSGFTVVASMEELGLRPPRVIGSGAPRHADVGDYSVLPEYEPEGGTLSGFTMVASPHSWDVPEPGGTMIVPPEASPFAQPHPSPSAGVSPAIPVPQGRIDSGSAGASPPTAGLPSFPRPGHLPEPVPNLYSRSASLPGGALQFEEQLTGMRPPASARAPASAETPTERAPPRAATRSASRALVEEALAQLRAKSEAKRKRTGANEVVKDVASKERTRRRKRREERSDAADPRLKELFQAAVAEIDKESPH